MPILEDLIQRIRSIREAEERRRQEEEEVRRQALAALLEKVRPIGERIATEVQKPHPLVSAYRERRELGAPRAAFGALAEVGAFGPLPPMARMVAKAKPETALPMAHFAAGVTPLPIEQLALGAPLPQREEHQIYRSAGGLTGATAMGLSPTAIPRVLGIGGIIGGLGTLYGQTREAGGVMEAIKNLGREDARKDLLKGVKGGALMAAETAPTQRLTVTGVEELAGKIPGLRGLTQAGIQAARLEVTQALPAALKSIGRAGLLRLTRAVLLETPIEAFVYGIKDREQGQKLMDSIATQAVNNLIMNVGFAGVETALDTKTLGSIAKRSVQQAITEYKAMPAAVKEAGFARIPGKDLFGKEPEGKLIPEQESMLGKIGEGELTPEDRARLAQRKISEEEARLREKRAPRPGEISPLETEIKRKTPTPMEEALVPRELGEVKVGTELDTPRGRVVVEQRWTTLEGKDVVAVQELKTKKRFNFDLGKFKQTGSVTAAPIEPAPMPTTEPTLTKVPRLEEAVPTEIKRETPMPMEEALAKQDPAKGQQELIKTVKDYEEGKIGYEEMTRKWEQLTGEKPAGAGVEEPEVRIKAPEVVDDEYVAKLRKLKEEGRPLMAEEQKLLGGDFSSLEPEAKRIFGVTEDPNKSLYIATDGQMIGKDSPGAVEHKDFSLALTGQDKDTTLLPKRSGMLETVFSPDREFNVRIFTDPTPQQIETVGRVSKTVPSTNITDFRGGVVEFSNDPDATNVRSLDDFFKREKGVEALPEITVGKPEEIISQAQRRITEIYNQNEETVGSAYYNLFAELETASKGERWPIKDEGGMIIGWKGKKSSFPGWIPDGLRSRKLIDEVLEFFRAEDIVYPANRGQKQRNLFDAILDEVDEIAGVSTRTEREAIVNAYLEKFPPRKTKPKAKPKVTGAAPPSIRGAPPRVTEVGRMGPVLAGKGTGYRFPGLPPKTATEERVEFAKQPPWVEERGRQVGKTYEKEFGIPLEQSTLFRSSLGKFYATAEGEPIKIKIRSLGDLQTLSHETGHYLDYAMGRAYSGTKADKGVLSYNNALRGELLALTEELSGPIEGPPSYVKTRRQSKELIAEFVSAYDKDPEMARKHAPVFTKIFEQSYNEEPEVKFAVDKLKQWRDSFTPILDFIAAAREIPEVTRSVMEYEEPANPLQKFWRRNIGNKVWDMIGNVAERVGQTRVGKQLVETRGLPPAVDRILRSRAKLISGQQMRVDQEIVDPLTKMSKEDSKRVAEILQKFEKSDVPIAEEARKELTLWGNEARKLGILNDEAFWNRVGQYFPYFYETKEFATNQKRFGFTDWKKLRADLSGYKRRLTDEEMGRRIMEGKWGTWPSVKEKIDALGVDELKRIGREGREEMKLIKTAAYPLKRRLDQLIQSVYSVKAFNSIDSIPGLTSKTLVEGWEQLPDTKQLGNLGGKYVNPDLHQELMEVTKGPQGMDSLLAKMNQHWKIWKVPFNPATVSRNIQSNIIAMWMGDTPVYNPMVHKRGLESFAARDDLYKALRDRGLYTGSYTKTELKQMVLAVEDGGVAALTNKLVKMYNTPIKIYGAFEDIAKTTMARHAIDQGAPIEEAIEYADKWLFDYSRTSRAVERGRKGPFPFITWSAKMFPRLLETLVRKPEKFALLAAAITGANALARGRLGITEEEEDEQKPRWMQEHGTTTILMPWKDEAGNLQYLDFSYVSPFGSWTQRVGDFLPQALEPGNPLTIFYNAFVSNYDPYWGEPIAEEWETPKERLQKQVGFATRGMVPSLAPGGYSWEKIKKAATGAGDYYGRVRELSTVLLDALAGVKIQTGGPIELEKKFNRLESQTSDIKAQIGLIARHKGMAPEAKEKEYERLYAALDRTRNEVLKLAGEEPSAAWEETTQAYGVKRRLLADREQILEAIIEGDVDTASKAAQQSNIRVTKKELLSTAKRRVLELLQMGKKDEALDLAARFGVKLTIEELRGGPARELKGIYESAPKSTRPALLEQLISGQAAAPTSSSPLESIYKMLPGLRR